MHQPQRTCRLIKRMASPRTRCADGREPCMAFPLVCFVTPAMQNHRALRQQEGTGRVSVCPAGPRLLSTKQRPPGLVPCAVSKLWQGRHAVRGVLLALPPHHRRGCVPGMQRLRQGARRRGAPAPPVAPRAAAAAGGGSRARRRCAQVLPLRPAAESGRAAQALPSQVGWRCLHMLPSVHSCKLGYKGRRTGARQSLFCFAM